MFYNTLGSGNQSTFCLGVRVRLNICMKFTFCKKQSRIRLCQLAFFKACHSQMNLSTYKAETDSQGREQTCGQGVVKGGGMDWEFGISRSKLLYAGRINNKVLLKSTGSYIQYPVINRNGKAYVKKGIYVYHGITLLYTQINTTS